jgi:hypothetical protein
MFTLSHYFTTTLTPLFSYLDCRYESNSHYHVPIHCSSINDCHVRVGLCDPNNGL